MGVSGCGCGECFLGECLFIPQNDDIRELGGGWF